MKMRLNFSFVLFAALALTGCDKSESSAGQANATKSVALTKTDVVKTAAAPTAKPKSTEGKHEGKHEGMNCGDTSCGGENTGDGEGQGCNQWDEAADEIGKREIPADVNWHVLNVTGMTCGGCERRIIANVGALDGVIAVEADSELSQVRVAVASGNEKASTAASAKINELGYKVQ